MKHGLLICRNATGHMIEIEFNTKEACQELFDDLGNEHDLNGTPIFSLWMFEKGEEDLYLNAYIGPKIEDEL